MDPNWIFKIIYIPSLFPTLSIWPYFYPVCLSPSLIHARGFSHLPGRSSGILRGCVEIKQLNKEPVFSWGSLNVRMDSLGSGLIEFFQRVNSSTLLPEGHMSNGKWTSRSKLLCTVSGNSLCCTLSLTFPPLQVPSCPVVPRDTTGSHLSCIPSACFLACGFLCSLSFKNCWSLLFANVSPFFLFIHVYFIYPFTTILLGFVRGDWCVWQICYLKQENHVRIKNYY